MFYRIFWVMWLLAVGFTGIGTIKALQDVVDKAGDIALAQGTEAQRRAVFVFDRAATFGYQKAVRDLGKSYAAVYDAALIRQKYKIEQKLEQKYKAKAHRRHK